MQFEKYRIKINPLDMHHVMAFASLYIGDSQTMAAEAGVLGVPFVRFNDFVGRIGYLRELEDKYRLGFGVHASPIRNDASSKPNEPLRSMSREQGSLTFSVASFGEGRGRGSLYPLAKRMGKLISLAFQ